MATTDNDKRTQSILDLILPAINLHKSTHWRPFVLGVTGLQGSGKSFLAASLAETLKNNYGLNTVQVSLDDFYLPHEERLKLNEEHPSYDLLKNRGQPSTHDIDLAQAFFKQFEAESSESDLWIPSFDKSRFEGDGDRAPRSEWRSLSKLKPVDVLIFEGWCIGFRPLPDEQIRKKLEHARASQVGGNNALENSGGIETQFSTTTLAKHSEEELLFINAALEKYVDSFMGPQHFDFMVHLDTNDLVNVYTWRMQQEHALRKAKGTGMTDQQVVNFVQRYMPGYELYLEYLRLGFFRGNDAPQKARAHLHVVLDINRSITELNLVSNKS